MANTCGNDGCKYAEDMGALKKSMLHVEEGLAGINTKLDLIPDLDKRVSKTELKLKWTWGAVTGLFGCAALYAKSFFFGG